MESRRDPLAANVQNVLLNFVRWLDGYGETSWDHQSYFAGNYGGWAKGLYYRHKLAGTMAVAPMIFSEAFLPSARRLFHERMRLPIADAHYAMGFFFLHQSTAEPAYLARGVHFLECLKATRCSGYKEYCWGYPFDWVTRDGIIFRETPLITTTPYIFDALLQATEIEARPEWTAILESIVRHVRTDIKDFPISDNASACSYTPDDQSRIVNAAAYRASLLTSASRKFGSDECRSIAGRNVQFVLDQQNPDGSWPYAVGDVRDFVDHFHTCFVMKALAAIHQITGDPAILKALRKGVDYYLANLFAEDGLPRPFAKAPRLTVYKRELYDCAECINLCLLLRDRFPEMNAKLQTVVAGILADWVKPDGSFRSRQLLLGWDNVPMHRWAQSQMFRALGFYLFEAKRDPSGGKPQPSKN